MIKQIGLWLENDRSIVIRVIDDEIIVDILNNHELKEANILSTLTTTDDELYAFIKDDKLILQSSFKI
jgi:hypothetical protein